MSQLDTRVAAISVPLVTIPLSIFSFDRQAPDRDGIDSPA